MRRVSVAELRGRAVETERGVRLGKCTDVILDIDTGRVLQFVVAKHLIGGEDLLVDSTDVIEVTDEKMVVRDASVPMGAAVLA